MPRNVIYSFNGIKKFKWLIFVGAVNLRARCYVWDCMNDRT